MIHNTTLRTFFAHSGTKLIYFTFHTLLLLLFLRSSGFIFPIENMPVPLQWVSNLMPPRWFIIIIKTIMLKGVGLAYIWKETLILFGMTLIFLGLGVKNFKIRLE